MGTLISFFQSNFTIDLSTPALLFPAISLLLLAYANRFLSIGQLIRQLKSNMNQTNYHSISRQIDNLNKRLSLIIKMQLTGVTAILFCTLSMITLFLGLDFLGEFSFFISLALMILSLLFSISEIMISGKALKIELEEMYQNKK